MARNDCIFCRITDGDIDADVVRRTDTIVAFRDTNPQAPTHVLLVPREHVSSLAELDREHRAVAGDLLLVARDVARDEGLEEGGYRVVANTGSDGGQTVPHLHLHLLGGRAFSWPPG